MLRSRLPAVVRPGAGVMSSAVSLYARGRAGFSLGDICPVRSAAAITVPTLVVHGEDDTMIPPEHSRRVFAAIGDARKIWRPVAGAQHGNVLMQGGDDLYEQMVRFFLAAVEAEAQRGERPEGRAALRLAFGHDREK
jgi:alpha-beta hydrolase superfamily lysophospholipase